MGYRKIKLDCASVCSDARSRGQSCHCANLLIMLILRDKNSVLILCIIVVAVFFLSRVVPLPGVASRFGPVLLPYQGLRSATDPSIIPLSEEGVTHRNVGDYYCHLSRHPLVSQIKYIVQHEGAL